MSAFLINAIALAVAIVLSCGAALIIGAVAQSVC